MNNIISILENRKTFSPFYFYTEFLKKVSNFYKEFPNETIRFSLIEEDDFEASFGIYYIDPISLPLLLSLAEQLKKYHNQILDFSLSNNSSTNEVLAFLDRADFFHLIGDNVNPTYPIGKKIFKYDKRYLGNFNSNIQRLEHKVRGYSLNEDNLKLKIENFNAERQRDYLVEYYTYKVKEHFGVLFQYNQFTNELAFDFIEILAELITNGVLHSGSDAYALMFSNSEKTSFSISDNGIGLYGSLLTKDTFSVSSYYSKFELFKELQKINTLKISNQIEDSLLSIFETLYYSLLKDRKGLFDLMCNVVLNCNGYFRLHNENAQIIVSVRMINELTELAILREKILNIHKLYLFEQISREKFNIEIKNVAIETKTKFINLVYTIFSKYHNDVKYSSIRFYEVKFKGVHIEVEIPNSRKSW
jgi:hypothetical protein